MVQIDADAVLWSAPERERAGRPLLVLLHGYLSHEGDLFSLAPQLPLEPVIASLRAPITEPTGYAWFPHTGASSLDGRLEAASAATTAVLDWLDTVDSSGVGLLGFSQGGAMSLELLRAQPERFDYALQLSGFLLPSERDDSALAQVRPPVFWGRGTADEVIGDTLIQFTAEWLPAHTTLTERIYEGVGHSVSPEELRDIDAFLSERLRD